MLPSLMAMATFDASVAVTTVPPFTMVSTRAGWFMAVILITLPDPQQSASRGSVARGHGRRRHEHLDDAVDACLETPGDLVAGEAKAVLALPGRIRDVPALAGQLAQREDRLPARVAVRRDGG